MKRVILVLSVVLMLGCDSDKGKKYFVIDGFALGTTYHIVVGGIEDTVGMANSMEQLFSEVNGSMSLYDDNSLINRLNRNETDSLDKHIVYCIELAEKYSRLSGGVYDITVKPLTEAWGFSPGHAQEIPDVENILQYVGYDKIKIEDGRLVKEDSRIQIDLNSVAKGYIVDLMAQKLEQSGSINYLVEIGGEIFCKGKNARGGEWTVGIDKPIDHNYIPGADTQVVISFTDRGLATSGNYRRFHLDAAGRKITHTVNAVTGMSSPSNLLSATVLADNCASADAAATMMMALGLERSREMLEKDSSLLGYLIYSGENGEYFTYISPQVKKMIK